MISLNIEKVYLFIKVLGQIKILDSVDDLFIFRSTYLQKIRHLKLMNMRGNLQSKN